MSFDIYVLVITEGDRDHFPRAMVERAFASIAIDLSGDHWILQPPNGESVMANVSIDEEALINGFSVNRPTHYDYFPELWDALYDVMRQTRTILFWPTNSGCCCIANAAFAAELPADFVADWPKLTFASNGLDVHNAIATDD
jgi:hypothetical protein